ncbi:MAG: EpsI family protein [Phycisphaerales bacterium]|nr:MAG: EpsI family protein [Phycisphaerales bacterium]
MYLFSIENSAKQARGLVPTHPSGRASFWLVWALAVLLLISTGVTYRLLASRIVSRNEPRQLPIPLSAFPVEIGDWRGKDVPIPDNVQKVAGNDDFLNRLYINRSTGQWANIYVAFCARPGTMLGHRPDVCYKGGGWVHDSTQPSEVSSNSGTKIPCLTHRFHWPSEDRQERVVLNFYILNGQLTSKESEFSGVAWRTPNIGGRLARYVAQVQISSVLENSVRKAAEDMTELILDFLPDETGRVRAAEYIKPAASPTE